MKFGLSVLLLGALAATTLAQQSSEPLAKVSMSGPPALRRATRLKEMEPSRSLNISVALKPGDLPGLQAFVDSVSDPLSPEYRHFLTPEQVGQRFGASSEDVQKMETYLLSKGMKVRLVGKNRLSILANATVAQAEAAFHTELAYVSSNEVAQTSGGGLFGYRDTPSVPAELAPMIQTVGGIENFTRPKHFDFASPNQLRTLYGVAPSYGAGFQGQNRTVAITSYDGFDLDNVPLLYNQFSLPTPANVVVKTVDPGNGGQSGPESGEGDLDIQCALSMAPLCNLIVYDGGPSDNPDPIGTLTLEADDNLADVITESYGWSFDSDFYAACHSFKLAMNAQGITNMAAAGDHGAPGLSEAPYPVIDPEVLSVGGTTISTDASGNRISETAWNLTNEIGDGNLWGGAGGWVPSTDAFNVLPSYQKGLGIPTNIPFRLCPDVALDADFSYEIFLNGVFQPSEGFAWGGTSASSPTFAGSLADIEGRLVSIGALTPAPNGHARLGRIQDLLYPQNGNSSVFFDITSGQIGQLPDGTTATAGVGWDFTTGLGAVNFDGLFSLLIPLPQVTKLVVSPTSEEGGSPTSVVGTITLAKAVLADAAPITLTSSDPRVQVPATVTVTAGASSVIFVLKTSSVSSTANVTITAKSGSTQAQAKITVTPPHAAAVTVFPTSVIGGLAAAGTVALAEAAPSTGYVVLLTSSNPTAARVPASVSIAAGQTKGTFFVTSAAVSVSTPVTVTATAGGKSPTAVVTVIPAVITNLRLSASSALAGQTVTGTITLSGIAPVGGATVALQLSSPSLMTLTAPSVVVPAGSSTGTFTVVANGVDTAATETVTASLNGVSKTATVVVQPSVLLTVTSNVSTLVGGVNNATITLTLNAPAGPSGVVVTLSSSPPSAAAFAVPSVTIPAGATTTTVQLTSNAVTHNTTVMATGKATYVKSVSITVTPQP